MVVRNGVIVVVPPHAVFNPELTVFAAITRHARIGRATLKIVHPLFQQLKNFMLKPEVVGGYKPDGRVLDFQVVHLPGDALDQRAVEQVVRQHHHLRHAQQALPLHRFFKARPGDAGEGQIDQGVVGFLHQPTRHLGHLAIRLPV